MGDDPELEAIRQRRMQQLMSQYGKGGGMGGGMPSQEDQEQKEEQQRAQEEQRQTMLISILQPQARERLARIALVKPEKARGVENILLQMAQRGQIVEKVSEERLISLLEQINEQQATKTKVTIQRRRPTFDDDDDF
ncbi:hypothetical protein WJX72_009653 [[Myrmecia] bisecta]|uniref:Programmed cell death protein 5 n=1 Tax=[Myrmecia] bisecta TaxID=41462 RepID=A0AAW1PUC5_9CHLO